MGVDAFACGIWKLETEKIERRERKERNAKRGTNPTQLFHFILDGERERNGWVKSVMEECVCVCG